MDFVPEDDDPGVDLREIDVDVRTVSVVWNADEDDRYPQVVCSGCSEYEAMGLLRTALKWLDREYGIPNDEDDDDD